MLSYLITEFISQSNGDSNNPKLLSVEKKYSNRQITILGGRRLFFKVASESYYRPFRKPLNNLNHSNADNNVFSLLKKFSFYYFNFFSLLKVVEQNSYFILYENDIFG